MTTCSRCKGSGVVTVYDRRIGIAIGVPTFGQDRIETCPLCLGKGRPLTERETSQANRYALAATILATVIALATMGLTWWLA